MSNSALVCYQKLSPNCTRPRKQKIDTITIHCMAGNLSVETCGNVFASSKRKASSNYGIGSDGRIALYVDEANASWCTSSAFNDNRAVTIEVANDGGAATGWHVSDKAYAALIDLLADICKRNGIKELKWKGDKSLIGQINKQNMTVHRWFANKACPGDYLYGRHGDIAAQVNKRLHRESEENMTEADVRRIVEQVLDDKALTTYNTIQEVPEWGRETAAKLIDRGLLQGDGKGLGLSYDLLRQLVVNDRAGMYD